jgi:hypothetical protein
MRRARRIDVWVAGAIEIDAMFQDSATTPAGGRAAIHEYTIRAAVDPHTMRLASVRALPRTLPYPECPRALDTLPRLVGLPLEGLRAAVLEALPGAMGCTHLNDAMRALAEVPVLVRALDAG